MHIAILKAEDASRYRQLMLNAYAETPDAFTSTAEERAAEPERWWVERVADPSGKSIAFGAFEDDDLVGAVVLEFSGKPKTRHNATLIGLYVLPGFRRAGAGKALVRSLINHCISCGFVMSLKLSVIRDNVAAVELYRSQGFQEYGIEPMAILGTNGFKEKVHMWMSIS